MNDIKRYLDDRILAHFEHRNQILLLLGARQVGKTTLLKRLFPDATYFLLDNEPVRKNFEAYDIRSYNQFIRPVNNQVIIDEIQLLSDPGRAAKILFDQVPNLQLIITGSSALNIKNRTSESLAGRKIDYHLYPLTLSEYLYQTGVEDSINDTFLSRIILGDLKPRIHLFDMRSTLARVLTYGTSPYLVDSPESISYLIELASSSIYKDILELNLIENRSVASNLLKLLAYQIGNLINYSELATRLGVDVRTVKRYIQIFEESFIVFRLYPYTSKRRDEIGKSPKVYFYDIGLRNAIINDFSDPFLRRDFGALFESFIIAEVVKYNDYQKTRYELSFWRTTQGAEIDLVLHKHDEVIGCEVKVSKGNVSASFQNRFPHAKTRVITMDNCY